MPTQKNAGPRRHILFPQHTVAHPAAQAQPADNGVMPEKDILAGAPRAEQRIQQGSGGAKPDGEADIADIKDQRAQAKSKGRQRQGRGHGAMV